MRPCDMRCAWKSHYENGIIATCDCRKKVGWFQLSCDRIQQSHVAHISPFTQRHFVARRISFVASCKHTFTVSRPVCLSLNSVLFARHATATCCRNKVEIIQRSGDSMQQLHLCTCRQTCRQEHFAYMYIYSTCRQNIRLTNAPFIFRTGVQPPPGHAVVTFDISWLHSNWTYPSSVCTLMKYEPVIGSLQLGKKSCSTRIWSW